jgi:hypothetical protein
MLVMMIAGAARVLRPHALQDIERLLHRALRIMQQSAHNELA